MFGGFASAGFTVTKEPTGLIRTDRKRPDGLTPVPWQSGKALCWDVTVACPLADTYAAGAAREAGSEAELAAARKDKYSSIDGRYVFEPIAIETLGVYSTSARQLLSDLGRKISQCSVEVREASFLSQRCSVPVQRFNAVLFHNSLPASDCTD